MKKKKITPKDLELNIEVDNDGKSLNRLSETRTCAHTKNICTATNKANCNQCTFENLETCGTTTIDPTTTGTAANCRETDTCWTIEPECETKVGCVDSASHAELCCVYTKQNRCQDSVDNCISSACVNSIRICPDTRNNQCDTGLTCVAQTDRDACTQLTKDNGDTCKPSEINPDNTLVCGR